MKSPQTLVYLLVLAGSLGFANRARAEQPPAAGDATRRTPDLRAMLEKGQKSGTWPDGLVVRISACLGELDADAAGKAKAQLPELLLEHWEFTGTHIHRVNVDSIDGKRVHQRMESRPFDSKNLCQQLLAGKALDLRAGKGDDSQEVLAGTPYGRGSRSLEVLFHDSTVLELFETNGPFLAGFKKSDAQTFGTLYEGLAQQARQAFESKPASRK